MTSHARSRGNAFAALEIDRGSERRDDAAWLDERARAADARYLLLHTDGRALVRADRRGLHALGRADCERLLSAGCAIQNMLLVATALGFASALTSGKALRSPALEHLFSLQAGEQAVCFLSLGTATKRKPARLRPEPGRYISFLAATP